MLVSDYCIACFATLGDDASSPPSSLTRYSAKTVAIDTSQNEQFTHRLIPAQSTDFDNVINQVSTFLYMYVAMCLKLFSSFSQVLLICHLHIHVLV